VAKVLLVQGTDFGVGKSTLVSLLCRALRNKGFKVSPFKSLALTTLTEEVEGGEMAFAQVVQARMAGVEPDLRMNPILVRPKGGGRMDFSVRGKKILSSKMRSEFLAEWEEEVRECLSQLCQEFDLVIAEGMGPARAPYYREPLSSFLEFANWRTAELADAKIILCTDEVEAPTRFLSYLSEQERRRVKGAILTKFELSNVVTEWGYREMAGKAMAGWFGWVYGRVGGVKFLSVLPELEGPQLDPLLPSPKPSLDSVLRTLEEAMQRVEGYLRVKKILGVL
jgi:adenosylcobyric acid synthase